MPSYVFVGDYAEEFPSLGVTLQPGETVETDGKVDHPRLRSPQATVAKKAAKRGPKPRQHAAVVEPVEADGEHLADPPEAATTIPEEG